MGVVTLSSTIFKTATLIISIGHLILGTGIIAVPTFLETFESIVNFAISTFNSLYTWILTDPLISDFGIQGLVIFYLSQPFWVYIPMILIIIPLTLLQPQLIFYTLFGFPLALLVPGAGVIFLRFVAAVISMISGLRDTIFEYLPITIYQRTI